MRWSLAAAHLPLPPMSSLKACDNSLARLIHTTAADGLHRVPRPNKAIASTLTPTRNPRGPRATAAPKPMMRAPEF